MNNIIIHPYIFEALKSYFLRTSENNLVPTFTARVSGQVVKDTSDWSCVLEERFKIQISTTVRRPEKRTREGETITLDTKKAKTFNVSFDEYTGPSENDRIEIPDDSEILDVEPLSGWEFDTLMPSWLKKAMDRHKTLTTAQTDPLEKFELAKQPIWWRIIDASDPKIVQDFISEEEFSELNAIFSNILNIGHQNDWTVLEPVAERCLQSLAKLNNEQIRMIGEMFKYEGIHGAVCKLRKIIQNIEELNIEEPDLFDDEPTNNKTLSLVLEKNDYLDKEVGYILELVRYTCEIFRQKNSATKKLRKGHRYVHQKTHFCFFNDLTEIVSEGSALVYAGYWKNTRFAIKTKEVINQINEIHLTGIVNPHPNIIQFCGVTKLKGETNYSLVLEYTTGGILENI
ncbi:unnamed protein product [Rhizophagus irregularis]|nr:unnamed protein product [Rhizophagus irregularis]